MGRAYLQHRQTIRWFIAPPMLDETLDSIFERAYHQYKGISLAREGWLVDICRPESRGKTIMDTKGIRRVAGALGVAPVRLRQAMVPDGPGWLAPGCQRAYCRACWVEDDRAGRPRYFRRAWAPALTLTCGYHHEPLREAPRPIHPIGDIPLPLDAPQWSARAAGVIDVTQRFATQLDACLFHGDDWPTQWRLDPITARNLLGRCVSNLLLDPSPCPAQWVWLGEGVDILCEYRLRKLESCRGSVWDSFRRLASPAARRAALWIVAWLVIPSVPWNQKPQGVEEHLMAQDPGHMAREETRSAGRRMRRLRHALSVESRAWMR